MALCDDEIADVDTMEVDRLLVAAIETGGELTDGVLVFETSRVLLEFDRHEP